MDRNIIQNIPEGPASINDKKNENYGREPSVHVMTTCWLLYIPVPTKLQSIMPLRNIYVAQQDRCGLLPYSCDDVKSDAEHGINMN